MALEPIALTLTMGTVQPRLGLILVCVWVSSVAPFAPTPGLFVDWVTFGVKQVLFLNRTLKLILIADI